MALFALVYMKTEFLPLPFFYFSEVVLIELILPTSQLSLFFSFFLFSVINTSLLICLFLYPSETRLNSKYCLQGLHRISYMGWRYRSWFLQHWSHPYNLFNNTTETRKHWFIDHAQGWMVFLLQLTEESTQFSHIHSEP